mmetsp:Transcript_2923/g.6692  ORF Transcript_2923/g.6692 Transcript_2923/m.6692 type:complete len:215 (+) Transcript_2923:258-902(+)
MIRLRMPPQPAQQLQQRGVRSRTRICIREVSTALQTNRVEASTLALDPLSGRRGMMLMDSIEMGKTLRAGDEDQLHLPTSHTNDGSCDATARPTPPSGVAWEIIATTTLCGRDEADTSVPSIVTKIRRRMPTTRLLQMNQDRRTTLRTRTLMRRKNPISSSIPMARREKREEAKGGVITKVWSGGRVIPIFARWKLMSPTRMSVALTLTARTMK